MKNIYLISVLTLFTTFCFSQKFVDKAVIEFEVNTNLKKMMSENSWSEKMKETMSDLKTSYYTYAFADNKSVFKFDRWSPKTRIPKYEKDEDEENVWYFDLNSKLATMQKQVAGTNFVMTDSLMKIDWKITNENREITGYNCRKAVGKIFGDVYVFAFYTDEIMISGGPCSINGLPGMILGLTIPRLHTSFVATKVDLKNIAATEIVPVKAKKVYTEKELRTTLTDVTKDWFTYGDDEAEKKKRKDLFFWNAFL